MLNTEDKVSQYSLNVLNELIRTQMPFTYATARSRVSASIAVSGLNLSLPTITYNGAFIFEPSGKIILSNVFKKEEMQSLVDFLNARGVFPLVYSFIDGNEKVSWIQGKEVDGMLRYLSLRQGDRRLNPLTNIDSLYRGDVFYITCIGEKAELQPIYDKFRDDPRYNCLLQQELYRTEYWCEIMPKAASKANAILRLKEIGNYSKIVSFGDALNDIPMFKISDECYAVKNAVNELKELATGIIESNDHDGVAKWLLKNYVGS